MGEKDYKVVFFSPHFVLENCHVRHTSCNVSPSVSNIKRFYHDLKKEKRFKHWVNQQGLTHSQSVTSEIELL